MEGNIVIIIIMIIGFILGIFGFGYQLTHIYWSSVENFKENERRKLGGQLIQDSYWFTENVPAYRALKETGKYLAREGTLSPDNIRKYWRNKIEKIKNYNEKTETYEIKESYFLIYYNLNDKENNRTNPIYSTNELFENLNKFNDLEKIQIVKVKIIEKETDIDSLRSQATGESNKSTTNQ